MSDALNETKNAIHKNLNVPGLVQDLISKVAEPALKDAVAKTETKLDDLAVAALAPILEAELNKRVKDAWESLLSGSVVSGGEPV